MKLIAIILSIFFVVHFFSAIIYPVNSDIISYQQMIFDYCPVEQYEYHIKEFPFYNNFVPLPQVSLPKVDISSTIIHPLDLSLLYIYSSLFFCLISKGYKNAT
jgi:hypothetical protein